MLRRGAPPRALGLVLALAILLSASACASRTRRPIRPGRLSGTHIGGLRGHVGLGAEYKRSVADDRGKRRSRERVLFREELGVGVSGAIVDPRLLSFALGLTLGLTETRVLGTGADWVTDPFTNYNVMLSILPEHLVPIQLSAAQIESTQIVEARRATPIVTTISRDAGIIASYNEQPVDAHVSYRSSQTETSGHLTDRDEVHDAFEALLRHTPSERVRTTIEYESNSVREREAGREYDSSEISVHNELEWDEVAGRPETQLRTQIERRTREGTEAVRTTRFDEDLLWRPTDRLDLQTRYAFDRQDDGRATRRHSFSQSVRHRLYQSLLTRAQGNWHRASIENGKISSRGASIGLDYQKQTFLGLLRLSGEYGRERRIDDVADGLDNAIDEPLTLSSTRLALLAFEDVVRASVVVTDVARTTVYAESLDYRFQSRGRRLELVRIPGGRIADGQVVLVSYDFATPRASIRETADRNTDVELTLFDALRLYVRNDRTNQIAVSGAPLTSLENLDERTYGAEFSAAQWRVVFDRVDHDSNVTPFTQQRVEVNFARPISDDSRIGATLADLRVSFDGDDLHTDTLTVNFHSQLARHWTLSLEPALRRETGRGADRNVFDLDASLQWRRGDLTMSVNLDFAALEVGDRSSREAFLVINVVRRF